MRLVNPNFITEVIDRDLASGKHDEVVTRFPPEPNGYLHIGHAKAIIADFGIAQDYGGRTYLRMDDTNPTTEDMEYVRAIHEDVRWLGFEPDALTYASDQFEEMYRWAIHLIKEGKAYVDSLSEEEIREYRGTVTEPGRGSPYRNRSVEENLDLFRRMRAGEFEDGEHVLRAKIDMSAKNMLMRDPLLYRIRHAEHYRTGDDWPIYPLYDYAHPLTDALEGITHSLCSLEFDNNREVYDWVVENTVNGRKRPHQYEFSRLQLDYTVLSKRRLIRLVEGQLVSGWDDPRMPTIAGLRRRGVTPEALRDFANRVGMTKVNTRTDPALLEFSIREQLNPVARRVMAVTDPLPVTISNFEGEPFGLDAPYWPHDIGGEGSRTLPFGPELYIDRSDFAEEPPKGFRRLSPGTAVRLRHGPVIRCDGVEKDGHGNVTGLTCSYWPDSFGSAPADVRVGGAIHWVDRATAVPAEFRLYDRLFTVPDPDAEDDFLKHLNPESLEVRHGFVESSLGDAPAGERWQFERLGYFWPDPVDSSPGKPVFNRIVTLKDSWARREEQPQRGRRPESRRPEQSGPGREREHEPAVLEFARELRIAADQAAVLRADAGLEQYYRTAVEAAPELTEQLTNWAVNELAPEVRTTPAAGLKLGPAGLVELVRLVEDGTLNTGSAREVLAGALETGTRPTVLAEERGLVQISDEAEHRRQVAAVLTANPDEVAAFRGGREALAGWFMGQVMRATRGRANPQLVRRLVEEELADG